MTDDAKLDNENSKLPPEDKAVESRRKFTKAGLGGGAVLMSLLSRPAMATGGNDPRCTGSILASIDAGSSLHNFDPDDCRFGCTPGFWCGGAAGLAWNKISQLTGISLSSKFSDVFACGPGPIAPDVDGNTEISRILCVPNEGPSHLKQSARHSLAAWLNANIMGSFFGPTPAEIEQGYCAAFAAWQNDNNNTGPLINWHHAMKNLNERGCPLNNDPNNEFYD